MTWCTRRLADIQHTYFDHGSYVGIADESQSFSGKRSYRFPLYPCIQPPLEDPSLLVCYQNRRFLWVSDSGLINQLPCEWRNMRVFPTCKWWKSHGQDAIGFRPAFKFGFLGNVNSTPSPSLLLIWHATTLGTRNRWGTKGNETIEYLVVMPVKYRCSHVDRFLFPAHWCSDDFMHVLMIFSVFIRSGRVKRDWWKNLGSKIGSYFYGQYGGGTGNNYGGTNIERVKIINLNFSIGRKRSLNVNFFKQKM